VPCENNSTLQNERCNNAGQKGAQVKFFLNIFLGSQMYRKKSPARLKRYLAGVLLWVVFFPVERTMADVVYLKDGSIIEGEFVSDTTTGMYFEVETDGEKEVRKFTYEEIETVDFFTTRAAAEKERAGKEAKKPSLPGLLSPGDAKKGTGAPDGPSQPTDVKIEDINVKEIIEQVHQVAEEMGLIGRAESRLAGVRD
jgi:hypothetical protein